MEREKSQAITKKRMTELSGELKHRRVSVVLSSNDPLVGPIQTVCTGTAGEGLLVGKAAVTGVGSPHPITHPPSQSLDCVLCAKPGCQFRVSGFRV